jgi:deoxycytidylate deaminase
LTVKFESTIHAINLLRTRYSTPLSKIHGLEPSPSLTHIWQHAIILAHIAAKRTDDAKVGVGAVLVYPDGTYGSVGWNGYPKKADILDYPQAGADDILDYNLQELKYDYILHAGLKSTYYLEQNALLWRMQPGKSLEGCTVVSTKMVNHSCDLAM